MFFVKNAKNTSQRLNFCQVKREGGERMTLENRVVSEQNPNGDISMHDLSAALMLWSTGDFTDQNVIDLFTLDATEQTQLGEIKTKYLALSDLNKAAFHGLVEAANIMFEGGHITQTKWKSILGITT